MWDDLLISQLLDLVLRITRFDWGIEVLSDHMGRRKRRTANQVNS